MPKERLHLLLADRSLRLLTARFGRSVLSEKREFAYFLGSISPDALFYDLPLNRTSLLGKVLHGLEGESCLPLLRSLLEGRSISRDPVMPGWILGVANHFLADGIWHPMIRRLSDPGTRLCREFKLSKSQCHHWLESELEGYWLERAGPSAGYLPLLRQFGGRSEILESCIEGFRTLLMRVGLHGIPAAETFRRCFFWQATLLRIFSAGVFPRWRGRILRNPMSRSLGALIVPEKKTGAESNRIIPHKDSTYDELLADAFMTASVNALVQHLRHLCLALHPDLEVVR